MEEGGFIMVEQEGTSKKSRGTDGVNTVQGVNPEVAKEYLEKQTQKLSGEGQKYTSNKEKRALLNNDFYKFQVKEVKKQQIEDLRKGFEEDRRRLAKMLEKKQEKERKQKMLDV